MIRFALMLHSSRCYNIKILRWNLSNEIQKKKIIYLKQTEMASFSKAGI